MAVKEAVELLREGKIVLIHDSNSRENEIDMALLAEKVTPPDIARFRKEGGGLICVALHPKAADNFGLPYLTEVYERASAAFPVLEFARANDLPYDERSAFSVLVNHRKTYTGITDVDRALTIRRLGELTREAMERRMVEEFGREFRTPGHVPILRAADGLVGVRRGHTELSVALALLAGVSPAVAICEMMDDRTGRALSLKDAQLYAEENDTVLVDANEIEQLWRETP